MPDFDPVEFENQLIEQMRANDGQVVEGPLAGHPLLVLTSTGAKSGQPRRAILTYSRDGDDFIVAGTAGGSPKDPSWLPNLRAHPTVSVETGNRTFEAETSIVADEAERQRLWDQHVRTLPWFAPYPEQSGRVIPVVRISQRSGGAAA